MKVRVVIEPGEDGWIVAECPSLPGCVSQGRTEDVALANIKEAIRLWMKVEDDKHKRPQGSKVVEVAL
ncbi:MAG: type II toxin-antitoxin system HicB family antitoxin [Sulfobacillus sp.]